MVVNSKFALLAATGALCLCVSPTIARALSPKTELVCQTDRMRFLRSSVMGVYTWESTVKNGSGGTSARCIKKLTELGVTLMPDCKIVNPSTDIMEFLDGSRVSYMIDLKGNADPNSVIAYYGRFVKRGAKPLQKDSPLTSSLGSGGVLHTTYKGPPTYLYVHVRKAQKQRTGQQPLQVMISLDCR